MNKSLFLCAALFGAAFVATANNPLGGSIGKKKLIAENSGSTSIKVLQKNIREYEANTPVDGMTIILRGGAPINANAVHGLFTTQKWEYAYFERDIKALKNTDFRQFTDNFLAMSARPGGADWFNDATWEIIAEKFGIMAKAARETRCVGLRFDPEHYSNEGMKHQFKYDPKGGKTWDEAWNKARQRGRQVGSAMGKEFPDIKFFCFFAFSYAGSASDAPNLYQALKNHSQGLYVAFLNGIFDSAGPGMKIIEGNESEGYRSAQPSAYLLSNVRYFQMLPKYLAPENQIKIRQAQIANAIYLDAYFRDALRKDSAWDIDSSIPQKNIKARLKLFDRNLTAARRWTSEYVWLYGELGRWVSNKLTGWKWGNTNMVVKYWNEIAPGVFDVVQSIQNPEAYVARVKLANLVQNANFTDKIDPKNIQAAVIDHFPSTIARWNLWRPKSNSKINFAVLPGEGYKGSNAVKASGFTDGGCLSQTLEAKPGDRFLLRAKVLKKGDSVAKLQVFYQKTLDRWCWHMVVKPPVAFPVEIQGEKWKTLAVVAEVPDGVIRIGIGLLVGAQTSDADDVLFSNVEIFKLNNF